MFATLPNRERLLIISNTSCKAVSVEASLPKMAETRGVAALSALGVAALDLILALALSIVGGFADAAVGRRAARGVPGVSVTFEVAAGCAALPGELRVSLHVSGGSASVVCRPLSPGWKELVGFRSIFDAMMLYISCCRGVRHLSSAGREPAKPNTLATTRS